MKTCKADGCDRPLKGHGLCDKHYQRAKKAGTLPGRPSLEQRFWAKVRTTETCWLWTGRLNVGGYGRFYMGSNREVMAHRAAYELLVGPVPNGLQLDHLCRVRHCVNPAHLEAVPQQINILRGVSPAATRAAQTHCKRGHEFTPENTRTRRNGWRNCRQCDIDRKQASRGGVRYPLLPERRTA